jgi:iron-sulfur cluster insertion protein
MTQASLHRVTQLLHLQPDKYHLRVYIIGGGCSGFQYGFELEAMKENDDHVFTHYNEDKKIEIIIDPISFNYLNGSTLDYKKDLMGQRFIVHNPHVKTTCGCGQSFSLKSE